MAFKVVVADPETGKSYQVEAGEPSGRSLVGMRVGDKFKGEIIGLPEYELEITGGSDKDGFPIRGDVGGSGRVKVVLAGGSGFNPKRSGERRRKYVRGKLISDAIVQVNAKITKRGPKLPEELISPKGEG
jgi:small subunit ribosomal protein S6e